MITFRLHPVARNVSRALLVLSLTSAVGAGTVVAAGGGAAAAAAVASPARVTVVPVAGDRFAPPGTGITFRGATLAELRGLRVVGSRSGIHAGALRAMSGGVVVFTPAHSFAGGEQVTVSAPGLDVTGVRGAPYRFGTAQPASPAAAAAALKAAAAEDAASTPHAGAYTPPSCPTDIFHSAPTLHPQQLCMNVGVTTTGTPAGTYLFVTPGDAGAGIYSDNGTLQWWMQGPPGQGVLDESVVQFGGNPYLAVWSGVNSFFGKGVVTLYNEHYQAVGQVTAATGFAADDVDLHEFQLTPSGDALFGIYEPVDVQVNGSTQTLLQYVVEEVSLVQDATGIHDGALLFEWDSLTDVPITASQVPDPGPGGQWDYFHGNAISQDTDGNLLVSARNTWGIYKIDATPATTGFGHVMWQVGAKGDSMLSTPWCYQHNITALGNNEYSLYDDGGVGPGCLPGSSEHPARALIVTVDPATTPAGVSLDASYTHSPDILTGFTGSAQVLPSGDVLVDWANVPEITEYTAAGNVVMDLSMSEASYRGFRYAWVGQPLTPPSIAASEANGTTTVWASWNGATDVASWQVLGGDDPAHLAPVGKPQPKIGFETTLSLPASYGIVAVEALSATGTVLATSRSAYSAGYVAADSAGAVAGAGDARYVSSTPPASLKAAIVGLAEPHATGGYWIAGADGSVFSYGGVKFHGSLAGSHLNAPIVGIAPTPDAGGYFLAASDGGVFNFGDAKFHGSAGSIHLNKPIVGIAVTPDGAGYWLVSSDGGIFNYGDARFHGSAGGSALATPVVSVVATLDGGGYWLFLANGTVMPFGDAHGYGSASHLTGTVVGAATTVDGQGYWLETSGGDVLGFGDAPAYSLPRSLSGHFVGLAAA